ncbi:MAG TPA: LamG-like jellyroll fold domain-containing protein [Actinomycetota bacterium]|nr:LamG-like jellyroll fold domain-containing protein [Actinomycetota bacterium]
MIKRATKAWLFTALVAFVLAGSAGAAYAAQVALWHMEDPTVMTDSADGNDGIPTDVQQVPGYIGNGYGFNGTTSFVRVPSSASLNPGSANITITAHVKFSILPPSKHDYDLVRKGISSTAGGDYKMEILSTGRVRCYFKGTSRVSASVVPATPINDNQWHTITCTKTANSVTATVDSKSRTSSGSAGSISNNADLIVGAKSSSGGANNNWYNGRLDEVSINIG